MDIKKIPDFDETIDNLSEEEEIVQIFELSKKGTDLTQPFPCGLQMIDNALLGGFREGDLVIVSGYSGHGKTTLIQNITLNYSKKTIPSLWFSYEMSYQNLNWKFKQMGCDLDMLAYAPMKLNSFSVDWIKTKIKQAYKKFATKIIFIDNLDFLLPTNVKYGDNEVALYKNVVKELKSLAMELDVIIFLVSHITKTDESKEPTLQNIYGSSAIYKLSDAVLFIWRVAEKKSVYKDKDEALIFTDESRIKIAKNRLTGENKFMKVKLVNNIFVPLTEMVERKSYVPE